MKISIIICTYNRELYLPKCLEHLKNQTEAPSNFEIILVNNNSTDKTENICENFIQENPQLSVIYIKENNPGLSFARNKGIETASGDILCFIDDDGFAIQEYVTIVKRFAEDPHYKDIISFGGKVIPCYNKGKEPKWISSYIDGLVSKVDLGDKVMLFTKKYPAGCNMVFRKEFFEEHGGFNVDLHTRGDDKFVFDKLKKAGLKTLYLPALKVEHFIDDYRLEKGFIIRLSKIIGQSEAIRLKETSKFEKIIKLIEYIFKFGAALIISLGFLFTGQFSKAYYLILVRWNVLRGFFIKQKI
jgi:glycosyltransferase involved in cell wall biosynthesis